MQFYCSNFPLLPTTSQLCCYIGKHEKAKDLDYISKGRNVGSAARSSFKFSRQSWTIGVNHTYSGIVRKILHELTSLSADVLWGSFVTHSFLRGGEMNAWRTNPKGRLRGMRGGYELTGKVIFQNWLCQKWDHRRGSTRVIKHFWAMNGLMQEKRFVLQCVVFQRASSGKILAAWREE